MSHDNSHDCQDEQGARARGGIGSHVHDCTPELARQTLAEGNLRFLTDLAASDSIDIDDFEGLIEHGQHPIAVVVTCSDSRVQPVLSFGMHMGDIFTIRSIGGFVGEVEEASVEYGVEHLKAPLVVVMGHTHCGLVDAAINREGHGAVGRVAAQVAWILHGETDPRRAEEINVHASCERLRANPILAAAIEAGECEVVGAIYDLATGKVDWI